MKEPRVVISNRAYASIVAETRAHEGIETGGILFGTLRGDVWYVLEVIDPGYEHVVRESAYFEYDQYYTSHLAQVLHRLYAEKMEIIGLWHRHPGSLDRFSPVDDGTNAEFAGMREEGAVSGLVNLDPDLRMTFYHVSRELGYRRIDEVLVGDEHMPKGLARLQRPGEPNERRKRAVDAEKHSQGIFSRWRGRGGKGDNSIEGPLSMVEYEMDTYLDAQTDYSYEILPQGSKLRVRLVYQGSSEEYPDTVEVTFYLKNGLSYCRVDGIELPYRRGIIGEYIQHAIDAYREQQEEEDSPDGGGERTATAEEKAFEQACRVLGVGSCELRALDGETCIERAYRAKRRKIKDYHPDNFASEKNEVLSERAEEETRRVLEAYELIVSFTRSRRD